MRHGALRVHFGPAVIVDGEAAPFGRSGSDHASSLLPFLAPTYMVSEATATPCGLSHITEMTCASDKLRLLASLISGQLEAYIGMRIDMVLVWRLRGVTAEVRVYPPGPCS
jgi:hypothetical protein